MFRTIFRHPKYKKAWTALGAVCVLGVGFIAGYMLKPAKMLSSESLRENNDGYTFIHPLLAVNRPDMGAPSPQFVPLSNSVNEYINSQIAQKTLTTASVYFINYGQSGSFALNQNETYAPASLLKIVVMLAYLRASDDGILSLRQEFTYSPSVAEKLVYIPFSGPSELTTGKSYTAEDLIKKMIIDSDNGAMNLLIVNINNSYLNDVYAALGLQAPTASSEFTISVKDYSLFFRILYNATYLSKANSEKALSLLSQASFKDGLVAGVPAGTTISHKFGEYVNGTGDHIDSVELHDCGIVYIPGGPYLLCVMTRGTNLNSLAGIISHISNVIYTAVGTK